MTHPKKQARVSHSRLMPWTWLGGMLGLVFAGAALAADPLYENDSVLVYTVPPQILPTIDATSFLNNNWFEVDFTTPVKGIGPNLELYETEDTVNYINIGTMVANSSILTNNFNLELSLSPGCGFNFDYYNTQSGLEQMAGNFYNPGSIRANSQVRSSGTYGVLKLTLHANSYDWQFIPVAGKTFTDSGTQATHS